MRSLIAYRIIRGTHREILINVALVNFYMIDIHKNKYVGPSYRQAEMYAGRVAFCPLASHGEYANGTDRQTDGRYTVTLRFPLDGRGQRNKWMQVG